MLSKKRKQKLGGVRFNFKMGIRLTFSTKIQFEGMVGGEKKLKLLNGSKALIFPIKWHEPFGLAIIESSYYGCPIFGTPYGSIPELVQENIGFLSDQSDKLVEAILDSDNYSRQRCHEYAMGEFNAKRMVLEYLTVISGNKLNLTAPKLVKVQKKMAKLGLELPHLRTTDLSTRGHSSCSTLF